MLGIQDTAGIDVVGKVLGKNVGMGMRVNPRNVVTQIERLLDRMPEVTKASGSITVRFSNGVNKTLIFKYN